MFNRSILLIIIGLFLSFNVFSFENKILIKIDDEIITTVDIYKETQYLTTLNKNIEKLSKEKVFSIAKNSLIKNKIKEKEIKKYYTNIKPDQKFINNIIKNNASKLGFSNLKDFEKYLATYDLTIKFLQNKLMNEVLWNELVVKKYSDKIVIDKNKIKEQIKTNTAKSKSYLLSEIIFNISQGENLKEKFKDIENEILSKGFENAALIYSISDTSSSGGKLGWIKENSINKKIKQKLSAIKINEYTKPIKISGGFLILKIENIDEREEQINEEKELEKRIKAEENQQLSQFSIIYLNKIKKDTEINEY